MVCIFIVCICNFWGIKMSRKLDKFMYEIVVDARKRMNTYRFTQYIIKRRPLLVRGFFGSGKTQRAGEAALYIYYKVHNDRQFVVRNGLLLPVLALPLRQLRDQVFDRFFDDEIAFKFKAHDEVEEVLRQRIREEGDYWRALAKHLNEDECKYKEHVAELLEAIKQNKIIVTTHGLAPIVDVLAKHYKRKPIVFFDEGEDFLERISSGVDGTIVESLKDLNKKLYQKVKRVFKKEHTKYYYRENLLVQLLRDVVILSATFPRSIVNSYHFLTGRELDETWVWTKNKKKVKDIAIFYTDKLLWKKYSEWRTSVYTQVAELVKLGVNKYNLVGIVSRNYKMTMELTDLLERLGYNVASDMTSDFKRKLENAQVIIITIKGKLYRGINILRNLDDVKVVLAFYQGSVDFEHHPAILDVLQVFGDGTRDLYPIYVREMRMAKNIQAVYRFVRRHENRHVLVFFDWRYHEALYHYFRNKLNEDIVRVEVDDLDKIASVAKLYI